MDQQELEQAFKELKKHLDELNQAIIDNLPEKLTKEAMVQWQQTLITKG